MALGISIVLLAAAAVFAGTVFYIRYRIRRFSRTYFQTDNIAEGLKDARISANAARKSIPAMTKLLLPDIQQDFPTFNWAEYKQKVSDAVLKYIRKNFEGSEAKVHEVQIGDYRKRDGTCYIKTYTSAGYKDDAGELQEKRYVCNLLYIQDIGKIPETQTGIGLNCPNCGAPVRMLGKKYCEYCGAGIVELNERVWSVGEVKVDE